MLKYFSHSPKDMAIHNEAFEFSLKTELMTQNVKV